MEKTVRSRFAAIHPFSAHEVLNWLGIARRDEAKIMAAADRHGLPVAICIESATPQEVKLATNTLVQMVIPDAPQNLAGDNA